MAFGVRGNGGGVVSMTVMRVCVVVLALLLASCGRERALPPVPEPLPEDAGYRLGVSDQVRLLTFGEESLSLLTVIVAHTTFCIGFVAIIVRARLSGMDESIFEAARDLGATPWQSFRLVTLPLIMPGVIAGALMAFTLSIDDFVITFFTAGAGVPTLPLTIYTMIKIAVTPEVNAVSTLLMLLTLTMIVLAGKIAPDVLRGKG